MQDEILLILIWKIIINTRKLKNNNECYFE